MQTIVIKSEDTNAYASALAEAAQALRAGELVIFPTETVYGVAANVADARAVAKLRAAKGRGQSQPFTVHLGQKQHARQFLTAPPLVARRFMRKAWPGPLTVVCEEPTPERTAVATKCPPQQLGEIYYRGTVGLRCPDHPVATRLLTEAGVPVVASSANRHGRPPPCDVNDALRELNGLVAYAIDAGPTRHNVASTVVEVRDNDWRILRSGAVDVRALQRLASCAILFVCTGNSCRSPMAEVLFRDALARRLGSTPEALGQLGYAVMSAGTAASTGGSASSGALSAMSARGLDLSAHRTQPLTVELIHRAERIYVMSDEHRDAVLRLVPGAAGRVELLDADGPVLDPLGGSPDDYRRCAEQIERAVKARLEELLDEDRNW